jgi:hypothetical protein
LRVLFTILSYLIAASLQAQTLGGDAAFNFLKFPSSSLLGAAGGINISYQPNDVGFAFNNPALLQPTLHSQMAANFTNLSAGIKALNLAGAYQYRQTTFGGGIHYIHYGTTPQTDASGNELGTFKPADYVLQASAAQQYLQKWHYGASLKFIHSQYGLYRAAAIAVDAGVFYKDSINGLQLSLLAKNMGAQLKSYTNEKEDLPFDVQIGITKRLQKAPFAFSLTAHHLHRFNLAYNDTIFNSANNFSSTSSFTNKLFNHFVVATHIFIGQRLEATVGYNHLRRSELSIGSAGNGLTGFSAGFAVRFEKLHISFARSTFQRNIATNQFGLNLVLDNFNGLGKL